MTIDVETLIKYLSTYDPKLKVGIVTKICRMEDILIPEIIFRNLGEEMVLGLRASGEEMHYEDENLNKLLKRH